MEFGVIPSSLVPIERSLNSPVPREFPSLKIEVSGLM